MRKYHTSCFQQDLSFKNNFLWKSRMWKHPYHLVDPRPWPLTGALGVLFMVSGLAGTMNGFDRSLFPFGLALILITRSQWWRDVRREGTYQGKHSIPVERGLRIGMVLFILSEVCFFASFFWAFFHSSLHPSTSIDRWPPAGVKPINPYQVPLLNTTILLSSGVTITWTHQAITQANWWESYTGFVATITLGIVFTILQVMEYVFSPFSMSDSVYGRTFFVATGFHGLHVIIGTIFIVVIWWRHRAGHFRERRHFGFEASAWYWHFVDVVWLFLYICLYWWGF